jgi:hypothetical protein
MQDMLKIRPIRTIFDHIMNIINYEREGRGGWGISESNNYIPFGDVVKKRLIFSFHDWHEIGAPVRNFFSIFFYTTFIQLCKIC